MWLCPKCNKENEDRMIFCAQCGFDESKNYEKYRVFTRLLQEQGETYSSLFKTANQDQEKLSENLSKSSENITWNVSLDTPENVQKGKKSKNYFGKIEIFAYLITILTAYFWGPMVITSVLGIFLMKFGKKEYFKQNNRVGIFWIFMGSWFNVVCFPVLVLGNIPLGFALSIMTTTAAIHCKKRIQPMKPACMKENDILVEYWISEKQSKEDCEIKLYLRHMRPKEKIKLKIPKASPLISYHKIAGKGKQDAQTGIRGDYYVKVVIETK